jgi:hypothetical protein
MDNDENNKRKQKTNNKEGEKLGDYKKMEGVSNRYENTATGRAASIKGHLNAARIVTLRGEEGGGGGEINRRLKIYSSKVKAISGNNKMSTLMWCEHNERKFKIHKINVKKGMQQKVHTTKGLLYTMQLYSRKTAWCAQVWEGAEKSKNRIYVLQNSVTGKLYIKVAASEMYTVKIMFTQTKNE